MAARSSTAPEITREEALDASGVVLPSGLAVELMVASEKLR